MNISSCAKFSFLGDLAYWIFAYLLQHMIQLIMLTQLHITISCH